MRGWFAVQKYGEWEEVTYKDDIDVPKDAEYPFNGIIYPYKY